MSTVLPMYGGQEHTTSDGRTIVSFPATRRMYTPNPGIQTARLRVAAYARVSTDHEEQQTSYEAQVDYYTNYIKSHADWEFAGMYADEGISATSTAKREQFKQMIANALEGKIDRILTKSVSRFARNTVDSLTTIRKLKDKGIGVTFEKENIDTLDSKGELLLTLMSSLAQEESRSISENTTWGQRKRFADGKVSMPYGQFLGYERGEDGTPVVNEEEAEIVRRIYRLFLDGKSPSAIARLLMADGIPTPSGKRTWQTTTVSSILQNEKYCGDSLLQKSFTVDFLTKKKKKNEGEVQQHFVRNSHPAIISREVYELAQSELRRRRESGRRICSGSIFAGKLICGECGGTFGSKVWNSTGKYRRVVWQCNRKHDKRKGATYCAVPHLNEADIQLAFLQALNGMVESRNDITAFYEELIGQLTDVTALEAEKARLESEGSMIADNLRKWINENARRAMDQAVYNARYDHLANKLDAVKERLVKVNEAVLARKTKSANAHQVLDTVREAGPFGAFDEGLFGALVDHVTVHEDRLVFVLKDGTDRPVER